MTKRNKKALKKNLIILIIVLFVIAIFLYFVLFKKTDKTSVVEEISKYSYTLDDRDTVYMRSVFRELKDTLNAKNINFEKYAELLTKLYVIDLYTMDNKNSKYDVGGFEYVHPDGVENFKLQVGETLYKYIGSFKKSELPEVINVEVSNISTDKYTYNEKEYDAYKLDAIWEYETNLGYDSKAEVTVMKDGNMLYIVEFNPEVK